VEIVALAPMAQMTSSSGVDVNVYVDAGDGVILGEDKALMEHHPNQFDQEIYYPILVEADRFDQLYLVGIILLPKMDVVLLLMWEPPAVVMVQ
jgi:hypothetical protein